MAYVLLASSLLLLVCDDTQADCWSNFGGGLLQPHSRECYTGEKQKQQISMKLKSYLLCYCRLLLVLHTYTQPLRNALACSEAKDTHTYLGSLWTGYVSVAAAPVSPGLCSLAQSPWGVRKRPRELALVADVHSSGVLAAGASNSQRWCSICV